MESFDLSFFINNPLTWMCFEKQAAIGFGLVVSGELFGDRRKEVTKDLARKEVERHSLHGGYAWQRILPIKAASTYKV